MVVITPSRRLHRQAAVFLRDFGSLWVFGSRRSVLRGGEETREGGRAAGVRFAYFAPPAREFVSASEPGPWRRGVRFDNFRDSPDGPPPARRGSPPPPARVREGGPGRVRFDNFRAAGAASRRDGASSSACGRADSFWRCSRVLFAITQSHSLSSRQSRSVTGATAICSVQTRLSNSRGSSRPTCPRQSWGPWRGWWDWRGYRRSCCDSSRTSVPE